MNNQPLYIYDLQTFLAILGSVSLVALVWTALNLFTTEKKAAEKWRQPLLIAFSLWAIASIGSSVVYTYNYFQASRPRLQGLKIQQDRQEAGL